MENSSSRRRNNNPSSSSSSRTDRKTIEKNRRNQMKALFSQLSSLVPHQNPIDSNSGSSSKTWRLAPRMDPGDIGVHPFCLFLVSLSFVFVGLNMELQETTSLPDQVDEATSYIKRLQTNLERLRERKDRLMGIETLSSMRMAGIRSPEIDIREVGSAMEVVLITGLDCQFLFNEIVRLLHAEGAEVVNASFSVVQDTVFHTIHSKVADSDPGQAMRISERLKQFVNGAK